MKVTTAIAIAKRFTEETSNLKDYKVRSKALRAGRESARALSAGRGYVIKDGRVYGYMYNEVWRRINLVAIR